MEAGEWRLTWLGGFLRKCAVAEGSGRRGLRGPSTDSFSGSPIQVAGHSLSDNPSVVV